jgi:chromosome segregation ATPase
MSEQVTLALIAAASLAVGALFTFLGIALTIGLQMIGARSSAKTAHAAGVLASDAAAYARVTDAQAMTQAQVNRQDVTIRELQKELSEVRAELVLANRRLEESEKLRSPLHDEIAELKKKVAGLEETVLTLNETIKRLLAQQPQTKPEA